MRYRPKTRLEAWQRSDCHEVSFLPTSLIAKCCVYHRKLCCVVYRLLLSWYLVTIGRSKRVRNRLPSLSGKSRITVVRQFSHIMASQSSESYPHFGTLATHAGQEPEQWKSLAVVPPISLSTTFKQLTPGQPVSSSIMWDDEGVGPTRLQVGV